MESGPSVISATDVQNEWYTMPLLNPRDYGPVSPIISNSRLFFAGSRQTTMIIYSKQKSLDFNSSHGKWINKDKLQQPNTPWDCMIIFFLSSTWKIVAGATDAEELGWQYLNLGWSSRKRCLENFKQRFFLRKHVRRSGIPKHQTTYVATHGRQNK